LGTKFFQSDIILHTSKLKLNYHFIKSFLTGIEFREPNYIISNKCTAVLKAGMVFQVSIGLSGLTNPDAKEDEGKNYALFIGDTVIVNKVSFIFW
jgi:nucleosome binding factor SPN SPT16 subunit